MEIWDHRTALSENSVATTVITRPKRSRQSVYGQEEKQTIVWEKQPKALIYKPIVLALPHRTSAMM